MPWRKQRKRSAHLCRILFALGPCCWQFYRFLVLCCVTRNYKTQAAKGDDEDGSDEDDDEDEVIVYRQRTAVFFFRPSYLLNFLFFYQ